MSVAAASKRVLLCEDDERRESRQLKAASDADSASDLEVRVK